MEWRFHSSSANTLLLAHRGLKRLPRTMISDNVTSLDASYNLLETVPEWISGLIGLEHVNFSSNKLTMLPSEIGVLDHVTVLRLTNNQLIDLSLPKELAAMVTLQELYLAGNKFQSIPLQILELHKLQILQMGKNKITEIPRDIVKLQKLVNYLCYDVECFTKFVV